MSRTIAASSVFFNRPSVALDRAAECRTSIVRRAGDQVSICVFGDHQLPAVLVWYRCQRRGMKGFPPLLNNIQEVSGVREQPVRIGHQMDVTPRSPFRHESTDCVCFARPGFAVEENEATVPVSRRPTLRR